MNRKAFIVVLLVLVLFSLNFSVAHEIDNSTTENLTASPGESILNTPVEDGVLKDDSLLDTEIIIRSNTTFDVIGDYFKIKLFDVEGNVVSNGTVKFTVDGKTYTKTTSQYGIAALQLKLDDGSYNITTKFLGNYDYKSSSKTTLITINNTRVVDEGLSNSEIQRIIDDAKDKNVILFKGNNYSDINLVITKRVTLLGNSNTVLSSTSTSPVITIKGKNASYASVKGFKINGGGNGISVIDAGYVTIAGNDIRGGGNGIVATGTKYLNVTGNDIVKNSKSGIVIANTTSTYIIDNKINSNGINGIEVGESKNTYIHGNSILYNANNGIYTSEKVNGKNYGGGPVNLHVTENDINRNRGNGIYLKETGDNINIKGNTIEYNSEDGIVIDKIGNIKIQSNVISNSVVGISYVNEYLKPEVEDVSYNVLHHLSHVAVEARDVENYDYDEPFKVGDNWYTDNSLLCPKVKSNNLKFTVTQVGPNTFQATFYDSKGNVASLLPDRTLTYEVGGQKYEMTLSGGSGVFTVDAANGDLVKATVDESHRNNNYKADTEATSNPISGVTPRYDYPEIPYDGEGESGDGDGIGDGDDGYEYSGRSSHSQGGRENTGNSTHSQQANPASNSNGPVNEVSQSYETSQTTSQAGASASSSGNTAGSKSQSVAKQIIIEEDDIYRVTGISFIVLLIILTIGLYYRDDIKEMNSKR